MEKSREPTPMEPSKIDQTVDESSDESFPASDPPSWAPSHAGSPDDPSHDAPKRSERPT